MRKRVEEWSTPSVRSRWHTAMDTDGEEEGFAIGGDKLAWRRGGEFGGCVVG